MLIEISNKLRNKIRRDLIILNTHDILYDNDSYKADLYFSEDEIDIWFEAFDWMRHIETYFKTSYNTYKIDCGRFKGVFPFGVYAERKARFYVYAYEKESWRDWFIMEGEINASKQFTKLLSDICNS